LKAVAESDKLLFDNRIGNLDVRGELVELTSVRDVGESLTRTIQ
jgi:hypothetical protein